MKKKCWLLLLCVFLLTSCGIPASDQKPAQGKKVKSQAVQYPEKTFDEVLDTCTDTAIGVVIENEEKLVFSVTQVLSGNSLSASQTLTVSTAEETRSYLMGEEYLLLLGRHISVFYDEDRYVLQGSARIPLKHLKEASILEQPLQSKLDEALLASADALVRYVSTHPLTVDHYGVDYLDSASMEDALAFSSVVAKVRLGEAFPVETAGDRTVYEAAVSAVYKGDCKADHVLVVLPADSGEQINGEERIIAAASIEGGSPPLLVPVSKESIYPVEQEEYIIQLLKN